MCKETTRIYFTTNMTNKVYRSYCERSQTLYLDYQL